MPISEQITPLVQRQSNDEEDEEIQAKSDADTVQRQTDDEEEEELVQPKVQGDGKRSPGVSSLNISFLQNGGSRLPVSTQSFFSIVIIGHQLVKADWNRFKPTKPVKSSQYGE